MYDRRTFCHPSTFGTIPIIFFSIARALASNFKSLVRRATCDLESEQSGRRTCRMESAIYILDQLSYITRLLPICKRMFRAKVVCVSDKKNFYKFNRVHPEKCSMCVRGYQFFTAFNFDLYMYVNF